MQSINMASKTLKVDNVKKIAVLRANAVGDFVVTLPALHAIRATYPNAEIVLLGKPWHKAFLVKGRTPIDRVIEVPVKKGIRNEPGKQKDEAEVNAFFERMAEEEFDVAINMQGSGVSANPFIKRLNSKLTVGLASNEAEKPDRFVPYYYYQSETMRFIEVASLIGAVAKDLEPKLNILQADEQELTQQLPKIEKPFIVLQAVATDVRRMWPIENFAPLANQLKQQGFEVVFTGSEEDKQVVDEIIEDMQYPAINTCGTLSLGGLCCLLSKAVIVISSDTGPLHLARAVDTPTVGVYWAPNIINWGPVTRSIHYPVVSWNMQCPFCGTIPNDPYPFEPRTDCEHLVSFVRDITVQQVLQAAETLLAATSKANNTTVLQ
ncbi:MAG: glycosyl transferase family 9 [Segetibacter sp.]|nr:glycosyl transferase family 9 [Segetibacter sp.]